MISRYFLLAPFLSVTIEVYHFYPSSQLLS